MRHPLTQMTSLFQPSHRPTKTPLLTTILSLALWACTATYSKSVQAATPDTAPPELKEILTQIDSAANRQDINTVMGFYSPNFSQTDGLTRDNLQKALIELWKRYPQLSYRTELQSWQVDGQAIVAETVTQISGTQSDAKLPMKLTATLRSRQRYEDKKIVKQEILAERTQITSGDKPPTVELKLPARIRPGEKFNFDAIVLEPLGNDLLMGSALEESVNPDNYINPLPVQLEPLTAGGIFKIGQAPTDAQPRWISAVLVRKTGITMITQRVNIGNR